ncbi:MAG: protein-disulfide reductase DsbD [Thiobacillaceae bacterium]|nr:protein-disulfide reductase DsbD [Thiobacillaceae bacterium]
MRPEAVYTMLRLSVILLLWLAAASTWAEEDLLEPDKAFAFSARMTEAGHIEARFRIAPGYYLYRDKIGFEAKAPVRLGKPALPAGKIKEDEFFGRVETYRGELRIPIPVEGADAPFDLTARFQGCADVGVCYPPQTARVRLAPVSRPAAPAAAEMPAAAVQDEGLIERLKRMAGELSRQTGEEALLPPDEAFKLELQSGSDGTLVARFTVAPGHYLYRDKIKLSVREPAGVRLGALQLPPADEKDDPAFGKTQVYHQSFSASARLDGLPAGNVRLTVDAVYQGCNEKLGVCYPPIEKQLTLGVVGPTGAAPPQPAAAPAEDRSETGQITRLLKGGNYWVVAGSFFLLGLGLALTPCVFPMIPILSGIIVGQGQPVTKRRGFLLSAAYVLGMAITYAIAGVLAGLSGTLISNVLQNPWALGFGAALFVALALSMFGFYELQLPSFLQSRLTEASNRFKGGYLPGVFAMGVISALIVGPCVAAPLAGALLYIGQTGDVVLGGLALFMLALGMGAPLLAIGLSAGSLLPKAGPWMDAVKQFFGVLMLAVAIWLISPLISDIVQMMLWAALLIISSIYLKAMDSLPPHATGWQRFWKGVGIIALVAGVGLLLGAMGGSRDLLQPLQVYQGGPQAGQKKLDFTVIKDMAALDAALQASRGRYVMLDFYADWCVSCKELERFTFTDPRVQERLKDVVLLKADVTANRPEDKELLKRFTLFGPPGIIFFDQEGRELPHRVIGFEPPDKFLASLDQVLP